MTRLSLALAALSFAFTAAIASAQSYPQAYSPYGSGPMQQAAYGYGAMPAGGMYPTPPNGMYPGLPSGGMYSGTGYPPGVNPGGYAPNSMPPGMYPSMPQGMNPAMQQGMYPSMAQNGPPQQSPAPDQKPAQSQSWPGQEYHGPQGAIAKANPPPMKLPRGVTSENGLLYYKGSPTADVDYQQFPASRPSGNPNRLASYQPGAENGAPPGSTPSVMNPGANYGNAPPSGNGMGNGNNMSPGCDQNGDQCQDCDPCCGLCHWLTAPYSCFYGLCHGCAFPGKVGYVWMAGYDNLAMTRNSSSNRTLLLLDTGSTPLPPIFNANELDFDWDYGGKAHIELIGPSGITYQFQYTRIATFVTRETIFGEADLTLPGSIASFSGFADADQASFYYSSAIQTGEFNMIFPFGSFEFLAGYRYMQVDEKAQIATLTSGAPATFLVNSLNCMNGGQIGGMGRWEMFGLIDFDFDAKFAVMGDAARVEQEAVDASSSPVGSAIGNKTRVAFVSELGAQLVLPIGPSWSAHCGYNVFFIDRVDLAPDQFAFGLGSSSAAGTRPNNHGDIVLQGVNLGVTARW